jgi:hypothetical protein
MIVPKSDSSVVGSLIYFLAIEKPNFRIFRERKSLRTLKFESLRGLRRRLDLRFIGFAVWNGVFSRISLTFLALVLS